MSKVDIPASWDRRTLSEVAELIQGQSPPGSTYNSEGKGLPFFQGKAEFGEMTPTAVKWCTEPKKIAEAGDVLISVRAPVGPTNLATERSCIGRGLAAIRPSADIPAKFLLYYLRYSAAKLAEQATGSTFQAISGKQLRSHPVVIPPLPEQHRIVEVIESYFTRLDDAVATLERVQRNLKRYRASVLKAAVEGRLVPTEAELARAEGSDYEPASVLLDRILAERRRRWEQAELAKMKAKGKTPKDDTWKKKYKEPESPETEGIPDLPEGWCWSSVDQLERGDRRSGYGVLVPGPDVPDGVLFIRVGDINDGHIDTTSLKKISREIADRFGKTYLHGGEVLITLVGTIGRTAVVPDMLAGANVARAVGMIPVSELVEPAWVECWFRSPVIRSRMVGKSHEVARKTLNLEDVRSAAVALPPLPEQIRIRQAVDDHESIIQALVEQMELSSVRSARLRQSILKWAFEGRLVDQDPTDEPATVLIDRIRAEREKPAQPLRKRRARATRKDRA